MPLGQYLKSLLCNCVKGTDITHPADLYVALYTANPSDADNSGTECTGTGYARVAVADTGWSSVTTGTPTFITNTAKVDFGTAGAGDWGTLIAAALVTDASGSTHTWAYKPSAFSKVINNGDPVFFDIGELEFELTS